MSTVPQESPQTVPEQVIEETAFAPSQTQAALAPSRASDPPAPGQGKEPSYLYAREKATGEVFGISEDKDLKKFQRSRIDKNKPKVPMFALERGLISSFFQNFIRGFQKGDALVVKLIDTGQLISGKAWDFLVLPLKDARNQQQVKDFLGKAGFLPMPKKKKDHQTTKPMTFNESDINWKELTVLGFTAKDLDQNGQKELLLEGKKTSLLTTQKIQTPTSSIELKEPISFKLQLEKTEDQKAHLQVFFKQDTLKIPDTLGGEVLSNEDKDTLQRTGHLGRVLQTPEGPQIASVDRELNTLVLLKPGALNIPERVTLKNGQVHELSKVQREELKAGKLIPLSADGGKTSDGFLVLNASTAKFSVMKPQKEDLVRQQAQDRRKAAQLPPPVRTRKKL